MKEMVLVIGSGRSGTSLAMQALKLLGCRISEKTQQVGYQNKHGAFEDSDVFSEIRLLFSGLGTDHFLGLPSGYLSTPVGIRALKNLSKIVGSNTTSSEDLWALKEPKSALAMELWIRVFNQTAVIPKIILAVRDPHAVVDSLCKNYGTDQQEAEYMWLNKNVEALQVTSADLYILHYENFLSRPADELKKIANFVGLEITADLIEEGQINQLVDGKVNRSGLNSIKLSNPRVESFYSVLKTCHGADFDRIELIQHVQSFIATKGEYYGGFKAGYKLLENKMAAATKIQASLKVCQKELEGVRAVERSQRQELLKAKAAEKSKRSQHHYTRLNLSFTHRLGCAITRWRRQPWRIIPLIWKLAVIVFDLVSFRGKWKIESAISSDRLRTDVNWKKRIEKILRSQEWKVGARITGFKYTQI